MGLLPSKAPAEKELCKPCAVAMERDYTVKRIGGKAVKITCASCGRRRYGIAYEVTKKRRNEK